MNEVSTHSLVAHPKELAKQGRHGEALQVLSVALSEFPHFSLEIMIAAYNIAQAMPDKSRYAQYQSRYFDFGIKPGDKVLDMGSGHIPFPLATHLAAIALEDHSVGRAGVPFKHVDGKPVYECSVEKTPFGDKEFDFVYCSHVLEHVKNPEAACRELMRIGKRGYIECPSRGKDTFFAIASLSNHLWAVECVNGVLGFTEYTDTDKLGVETPILLDMNCAPQSMREKCVAALDLLRADRLNVMLMLEDSFPFEVRRQKQWPTSVRGPQEQRVSLSQRNASAFASGVLKHRITGYINKVRSKLARIIAP